MKPLPAAWLLSLFAMPALAAASPPAEFGDDHDDPRTAYPTPAPEGVPACTVDVLRHGFTSFEPARATIDAARQCPGPWHRVVLRIDGAVKGRQYDRIGHVAVGGVTVFRTSTPEPSVDGIQWHVEKDVTAYAPLFATPQPVELHVGNVINETYTGVFDVGLRLQFYRADAAHPAAETADQVLALQDLREQGQDTIGSVAVPANALRVVAEVYATGSGGGCEEFWYFATTVEGYWCRATQGPYREVQVWIDGQLAGIAAPYPHIYTGGWSNPSLWYTIPAPRAFDIAPVRYELTPFIGLLNDGRPHQVRFHVAGLDAGREGWKLMPNLQVWRDPGRERVSARLLQVEAGEPAFDGDLDTSDARRQRMQHRWQRRFLARGVVEGSRGAVETTVERTLDGDVHHRWTGEEDGDDRLLTEWRDLEAVTRRPRRGDAVVETLDQRFGLDGSIRTRQEGGAWLTSTLDIHDDAWRSVRTGSGAPEVSSTRDRYVGTSTYLRKVPREQRRPTADTRQTWRREDASGCVQRRIVSINGMFTEDESGACGVAPSP